MVWVCKYCSSNNTDVNTACEICGKSRHYRKTTTLTKTRVDNLGFTGNVIIPDSYNIIGESAFKSRADVTRVELPSTIRRIDKDAFFGCVNLQEVVCKGKIASIRSKAFCNCIKLRNENRPTASRHLSDDAFSISEELAEIDSLISKLAACKARYEKISRTRRCRSDDLKKVMSKISELISIVTRVEKFRLGFLLGLESKARIREFWSIVTAFERAAQQFENEDDEIERMEREASAAAIAEENRRKKKKRKTLIGSIIGCVVLLVAVATVLIIVL